jgi:NAD(P)-dependent dehydrogenase (short-subunit alcohol dehydrogenase family)
MSTLTPTPLPPLPTPFAPDHLNDRVILVTGAGDGLGRAIACAAAAHGATVVLLGRTIKKLEATDDAIQRQGSREAGLYPLNLTGATWGDLAEVAMTLEKTYGRLDGIVHAAAHFKTFAKLEDVEPKDWLESLQVNLTAAFALTRHCLPLLRAAPDASVVFVTDRGGRQAKAFQGAYGISKAAVEMMSAQWALEQPAERRLRFNTYDPGPMRTGLRLKGYPGEVPEQVPPPEDAVPGLLWLLGPGSRGVNGEALRRG